MCEPHHSIVQWSAQEPDQDQDNGDDGDITKPPKPPNNNDGDGGAAFATTTDTESRVKAVFGKTARWLKKIGGWLNLSKFGAGHHSTSGRVVSLFGKDITQVGTPNLYESRWWDLSSPELDGSFTVPGIPHTNFSVYDNEVVARKLKPDGYWELYATAPAMQELVLAEYATAIASATKYDVLRTSANMSVFRRFLEESLRDTQSPGLYLADFVDRVVNVAGRDKWLALLKKILLPREIAHITSRGSVRFWQRPSLALATNKKEQVIRATLGITRDRKLLQSHFASCDRLWT